MARIDDWPTHLAAFIESRRNQPFAWGANDCGSFAFAAANLITGRTVRALEWHDLDEGLVLLRDAGNTMEGFARESLGEPLADPRSAQRGDIGLVPQTDGGPCGLIPQIEDGRFGLMVCTGLHWVGPGVDGLLARPLQDAVMAWRVD